MAEKDVSWAANAGAAEAGRAGELVVGRALNEVVAATDGAVVMHDLRVPVPKLQANIDHVVIAGNRLLLIDAKRWRPGAYFSVRRRAYRGFFRRCEHIERKSMILAAKAMRAFVREFEGAEVSNCLIVPTPSSGRWLWTLGLYVPGADVVSLRDMRQGVAGFAQRFGSADPQVVAKVAQLLPEEHRPDLSAPEVRLFDPTGRKASSYWDGAPMSLNAPLDTDIPPGVFASGQTGMGRSEGGSPRS